MRSNEIVLFREEAAQMQAEGTVTRWLGQVLVEQLLNQFSWKPAPLGHARGEAANRYQQLSARCRLSGVAVLCAGLDLFFPLLDRGCVYHRRCGLVCALSTHTHTRARDAIVAALAAGVSPSPWLSVPFPQESSLTP